MSVHPGSGPVTPLAGKAAAGNPRERRRRRRERNGATDPATDEGRAQKERERRITAILIALGIALAVIVPITVWSHYSTSYVTSRNATVKGAITQVGAQIDGVITGMEVEPGQRVRAGQVLARFEDHQLQANLLRAEARLRETKARATSAETRIDAARTQSHEARFRYQQRVPLARTGAIALDEMRAAETRLQTAVANERTALADHEASNAEVNTAEAEVAIARANVDATVIRAPADGRVVRRIGEPGVSVVVGQPVVAVLIGNEIWIEAWIDQASLSQVAVGNDVRVHVSSFPGRTFHGKVVSIGVSTDFELPDDVVPQSRKERIRSTPVVPVRVRLDDSIGLMPGLTADVAIQRTRTR